MQLDILLNQSTGFEKRNWSRILNCSIIWLNYKDDYSNDYKSGRNILRLLARKSWGYDVFKIISRASIQMLRGTSFLKYDDGMDVKNSGFILDKDRKDILTMEISSLGFLCTNWWN